MAPSLPRPRAACALVAAALLPGALAAQSATANLRGYVTNAAGAPVAAAQIEVRNTASGVRRGSTTNQAGFYNVGGLPPGEYVVRVIRIGFAPTTQGVRLPVGEVVTRDVRVGETAVQLGAVRVTGATRRTERSTSEVAGNVSTQQIENLPQNNRNFLDFAALVPGVQRRDAGVSSGGLSPNQSNLFVDGASYKSDLLPGGIAGQDPGIATRDLRGVGRISGNPFPQNAVQEFRVITQNYKAEYQKASGAVISAATKSGTNDVSGDVFFYGQNRSLLATSYYDRADNVARPEYKRAQFGGSVGGPVVRDKLHYFASYEGNYIDLNSRVVFRPPAALAAQVPDSLLRGQDQFATPFHSNLLFGKVDYAVGDRQSLVLTANVRRDKDRRGIGGSTAAEGENDVRQQIDSYLLRHTYSGGAYTNEAQLGYQRQGVLSGGTGTAVRLDYGQFGVVRGAFPSAQNFRQQRFTVRDDFTYTLGSHVLKAGALLEPLRYDVDKRNDEVPTFRFNPAGVDRGFGLAVPYEATLQIGDPRVRTNNTQLGLYAQDDWTIARRLTLNLGLRWDYETNGLNNTFRTPQIVRDSIGAFARQYPYFDPARYFTNGPSDRKRFAGAFQPRLGFSYDVNGAGRTLVFGGAGLFYDRFYSDILLDEQLRTRRLAYRFSFKPAGNTDPALAAAIPWDPGYLSRDALVGLVSSGVFNKPEAYLIPNDLRPPRAQQASLGVRQQAGAYQLSLTGSAVNGVNGLRYVWGNREVRPQADFGTFRAIPGFGAILRGTDAGRTWYRALLFQASRPLTDSTRFGGDLSYTLAKTTTNTVNGDDPFALDYVSEAGFSRINSPFDERHRIVLNLVTRIPFGIRASTLTTLASSLPYLTSTNCDETQAQLQQRLAATPADARLQFCQANGYYGNGNGQDFDDNPPGQQGVWGSRARGQWFGPFGRWAFRQVDLRLQKDVATARGQRASVFFDVYNLFNFNNFNYQQFRYGLFGDLNATTGARRAALPFQTYDARRAQVGVRYGF